MRDQLYSQETKQLEKQEQKPNPPLNTGMKINLNTLYPIHSSLPPSLPATPFTTVLEEPDTSCSQQQ